VCDSTRWAAKQTPHVRQTLSSNITIIRFMRSTRSLTHSLCTHSAFEQAGQLTVSRYCCLRRTMSTGEQTQCRPATNSRGLRYRRSRQRVESGQLFRRERHASRYEEDGPTSERAKDVWEANRNSRVRRTKPILQRFIVLCDRAINLVENTRFLVGVRGKRD